MNEYWKSKEGVAERERRSKDAYLAPMRAKDFQDGKRRRAEAEARYKALLEAEEKDDVKKGKKLKSNRKAAENYRKRKSAEADDLVQEVALLTEEGVALLGRLGCGAEKLGLGDDAAGEILDRDDIRKDEEAIEALVKAKNNGEAVDAKEIKKKRRALKEKERRARKKAKLEKDQRSAKELPGRVAELEKQVCLLEFALDVM